MKEIRKEFFQLQLKYNKTGDCVLFSKFVTGKNYTLPQITKYFNALVKDEMVAGSMKKELLDWYFNISNKKAK